MGTFGRITLQYGNNSVRYYYQPVYKQVLVVSNERESTEKISDRANKKIIERIPFKNTGPGQNERICYQQQRKNNYT